MAFFTFELVTPERIVVKTDADQITLPTPDGEITLLPHHIPLVTLVAPGELRLVKGSETTPIAVSGGYLEVQGAFVRLLTDAAERIEEIDEQRAEEARKRAEVLKQETYHDEKGYTEATAALERSLARLKLARKYRHLRKPRGTPPPGQ
jgi:F-type H+-transporting ATPase subunit epsilon